MLTESEAILSKFGCKILNRAFVALDCFDVMIHLFMIFFRLAWWGFIILFRNVLHRGLLSRQVLLGLLVLNALLGARFCVENIQLRVIQTLFSRIPDESILARSHLTCYLRRFFTTLLHHHLARLSRHGIGTNMFSVYLVTDNHLAS